MQQTPKQGSKLRLSRNNDESSRRRYREASSTPIAAQHVSSPTRIREAFGDCSPRSGSMSSSPISFLSTQDEKGENDVVWNYYSPKADRTSPSRIPAETPVRKRKKNTPITDFSPISRLPQKKKLIRPTAEKKEFLKELKAELSEINKNLKGLMCSDADPLNEPLNLAPSHSTPPTLPRVYPIMQVIDPLNDSLMDDLVMCTEIIEERYGAGNCFSPLKMSILDKIAKQQNEGAIESDDSMNECLLKASQMVEEEISCSPLAKSVMSHHGVSLRLSSTRKNNKIEVVKKKSNQFKKMSSPKIIINDSFDNIISDMNDADIEILSQARIATIPRNKLNDIQTNYSKGLNKLQTENNLLQNSTDKNNTEIVKDLTTLNSAVATTSRHIFTSDSLINNFYTTNNNDIKNKFGRHNSMPVSPSVLQKQCKPSTSSGFMRHKTMPSTGDNTSSPDSEGTSSPIPCTPEEIEMKRRAARDRLQARRVPIINNMSNTSTVNIENCLNTLREKFHESVNNYQFRLFFSNNNDYHTENNHYDNTLTENTPIDYSSRNENHTNNNITQTVNNFPATNGASESKATENAQQKENNIQEEIERKRQEALIKLQKKRSQGVHKGE